MSGKDKADKWVLAGLAELGRGGIEGVRVEVLAQQMGVTKGGFYRQFKDRDALLARMLDRWVEGRIETIEVQVQLKGEAPEERLRPGALASEVIARLRDREAQGRRGRMRSKAHRDGST